MKYDVFIIVYKYNKKILSKKIKVPTPTPPKGGKGIKNHNPHNHRNKLNLLLVDDIHQHHL